MNLLLLAKIGFILFYFVSICISRYKNLRLLITLWDDSKVKLGKKLKQAALFIFEPFLFPFTFFTLGYVGGFAEFIPHLFALSPIPGYWSTLILVLLCVLFFDRLAQEYFPGVLSAGVDRAEAEKSLKTIKNSSLISAGMLPVYLEVFSMRVAAVVNVFLLLVSGQAIVNMLAGAFDLNLITIASYIPGPVTLWVASSFSPTVVIVSLIIFIVGAIKLLYSKAERRWDLRNRWFHGVTAWLLMWLDLATIASFGLIFTLVLQMAIIVIRMLQTRSLSKAIYQRMLENK